MLEKSLMCVDQEILFTLVKDIIKENQKEEKIKEIEQLKKKEKRGYFGGFFQKSTNNEEDLISEEERDKMDKFFEENFSEEKINMSDVLRPMEYVWFCLEFQLEQGVFF